MNIQFNVINGTPNDELLVGTPGNDQVFGDAGNDLISTFDGNDLIDGGTGDDLVLSAEGEDTVSGGDGNDFILGSTENDSLSAGDGLDFIIAGAGDDNIDGGDDDDAIFGNSGSDYVEGGDGDDLIIGNDGDDTLSGGEGNDNISGLAGANIIFAGPGNDRVSGGPLDNQIFGETGDDQLVGATGNDLIEGGEGSDRIVGGNPFFLVPVLIGPESDTLTGGSGPDTFVLGDINNIFYDNQSGDSLSDAALITDFDTNEDVIQLQNLTEGNYTLVEGINSEGETFSDLFIERADAVPELIARLQGLTDLSLNENYFVFVDPGLENGRLNGTSGDDLLTSTRGDDRVSGRDGNDYISSNEGNDTVSGGDGDDIIIAEPADDFVRGGNGDDDIFGIVGRNTLDGGRGNDLLFGGAGDELIRGGAGIDDILGGDGNDTIKAGFDNDRVLGENGDDDIKGNQGNDDINGGDGKDTITGGRDNDRILGDLGDDVIFGNSGDDILDGGSGNDTVKGGAGDDFVFGGLGDDNLKGKSGNDQIIGASGNDLLAGGSGDDRLIGVDNFVPLFGFGRDEIDTLTGGRGRDIFVLGDEANVYYDQSQLGGEGYALITDFNPNRDLIQLKNVEGSHYVLSEGVSTTDIFLEKPDASLELIARLQDVTNLNLSEDYFMFVETNSANAHPEHSHFGKDEVEHEHNSITNSFPTDNEVLIVPPDASNRQTYSVFTGFSTFLAVTEDTGGTYSLFNLSISPQTGPPPHRHGDQDEAFYVLEGEVELTLGNETFIATPGTFAFVPRGRRHAFANPTSEAASLLAITTPSGFEGFFQEEGGLVTDPDNPPPPRTDFREIAPIAARFDTILAIEPESEVPPGAGDVFSVAPDLPGRDYFSLFDSTYSYLATEEETGGQFELFHMFLPSQGAFKQFQKDTQQANSFYIREGEVTFWIGGETTTANAGTFIYIPAGTPYAYQNLADTHAETLLLNTPKDISEPATGNEGNDIIFGDNGFDVLSGGDGKDLIFGGNGKDRIIGGNDDDQIFGQKGGDLLDGDFGNDFIDGGDGKDFIFGNFGDDNILGGDKGDLLIGASGNDILDGGDGKDELIGIDPFSPFSEFGRDEIDILTGGDGRDTFVLGDSDHVYYEGGGSELTDAAIITDFNANKDVIQLKDLTVGNYVLVEQTSSASGVSTNLFLEQPDQSLELIANLQGVTELNLNQDYFEFV